MNASTAKSLQLIQSSKEEDILTGLAQLRANGNLRTLPDVIALLAVENQTEAVANAVANYIFDVKDQNALPIIIDHINHPDFKEYQRILVSACWENGLDCTLYLEYFVDLAIISDYLVTLECISVIENMENKFSYSELDKMVNKVKEACDADEDNKFDLLNMLWEILVDLRAELQPEN